jgi:hypothetical protein
VLFERGDTKGTHNHFEIDLIITRGGKKMKKVLSFTLLFLLLFSTTVFAEETKPILENASLEVTMGDNGSKIVETITISNANAFTDGKIEHILSNFGEVNNFSVTSGGSELDFQLQENDVINKVFVNVPEGTTGDLSYVITFDYVGDTQRIPFVVPAITTDGNGNDVLLKVTLPEGQYLHDSFPIIDSGDTGSVQEYMMNVPTFTKLKVGETPPGFFTASNMYTLFGLSIILGIFAIWGLNERRMKNKAGGVASV